MSTQSLTEQDTIAAIATANGYAGVGVVRVSGPHALVVAKAITRLNPNPRHAHFTSFYNTEGLVIDEGLVLYFPAPHSFTGEEVVEFQGHGSPVVLDQVLQACLQYDVRMARAGEFSERAFLNQKMDLLQAESLANLIAAGSAQAARSAVNSLQGKFSTVVQQLQAQLMDARKEVEACIDFSDEDIEHVQYAALQQQLSALHDQCKAVLKAAHSGQVLQHGLTAVLAGKPNAGKSTLLNALAEDELAIVTPIAGTTRDQVRATIHLQAIPLHIIDTAGLRQTEDVVELHGIERTHQALSRADIMLWLCDASASEAEIIASITELKRLQQELKLDNIPLFFVLTKVDLEKNTVLIQKLQLVKSNTMQQEKLQIIKHNNLNQDSLRVLRNALSCIISSDNISTDNTLSARTRHITALKEAEEHIAQALKRLDGVVEFELSAEELRIAQLSLSKLTGEVYSDDLLGEIFSSFCVGK